jgi:hypothetical protein
MEQLVKNKNKLSSKEKEFGRKSKKQSLIRFTDKEYKKVSTIAQKKNKSIPALLKACFETVGGNPIEIPINELKEFTLQLMRIGNNVNTALRKINSGEYHMLEDIKGSFETSATEIQILKSRVRKIL